jgi:glycosyltransferase involved in cell wall biosynthesis
MRVAIDARYIWEKPSGIGAYVRALVDRLPREAPSDRFLLWAHPRATRPLSDAPNAEAITVRPGPNSPLTMLWPRRYAPFDGVDVFHSPHNVLPRGLACATVATIQDVMAIEHPGLHLQGLERAVKSAYYPQAVRRALDRATRLIVTTVATADRVRRVAPNAIARVRVIALAADACFHPAADPDAARRRAASITGSDAPYLLVVGQNSAAKRHRDAIAAVAAGVPRPWRLVLQQRQGASAALTRLARRLHVHDRVVWLPALEHDDVVALMQAAGALVQPSLYEGFGLPVLEAMACGCPVVATDIPPLREVTGGAAVLVPPTDVARLAAALREVTDSAERRFALAGLGLERARAFSWDRCARETLEVYREAFG